jgi:hypothetical protein
MASASRNLERGVEDQQVMGSSASGAEDEKGKMEEADLSSKDQKDPMRWGVKSNWQSSCLVNRFTV